MLLMIGLSVMEKKSMGIMEANNFMIKSQKKNEEGPAARI